MTRLGGAFGAGAALRRVVPRVARRAALLAGGALAGGALAADVRVIDDFADASRWHAGGSDQVSAQAERGPRGALCLRYDFNGVSGYAVLRRALDAPLDFPAHYALELRLAGRGPANALQLKFVDAGGDNVWWLNRPGYVPPARPSDLRVRQRQIEFAWGPTADRVLRRAAAIELVVASGSGGAGELCFERLALRALPPPGPPPPWTASATSPGAALAIDGDAGSAWRSARGGVQSWQLDFGAPRELSGLMLRFAGGARAVDFDVQFSDDARRWHSVRRVRGNGRDALPLWLPESETRFVRLLLRRGLAGRGCELAEVQAPGPLDWPTRDALLAALAKLSPPSALPRAYHGEQGYWTAVGVDGGGAHAALVSEDGAIEPRKGGPSLEPFVIDEHGRAHGRAEVRIAHALREGYLPLPQVRWSGAGFDLQVEAGADGPPERAQLVARYTLTNREARRRRLTLALALRPWQVNPPRQFLNTPGGVAEVREVAWRDARLRVDGRTWLVPATPPDAAGAARFEQGDVLVLAARGALPPLAALRDDRALAGALLRWRLDLAPGETRSIDVVLPLADDATPSSLAPGARLDAIAAHWRERLNRVAVALPDEARPLHDVLRSMLAQILVARDGAALQPGTRAYARTWIRDGTMMVAGLLRLGEVEAARDFVRWYAGKLFASGKVPCCVDARGADPVAENDSAGEFIHAVAELWRHTRERDTLATLWPQVDAAARYMEGLRQSERRPALAGTPLFGLLPASISHEGYSAKPMHAYWDDFWALAGYRDAARLARVLGHDARAGELERQRDEFRADLKASLAAAVAQHGIDYLPGAAELGDYDPTSSTIVFSPAGAETLVAPALLEQTWARWWRESLARRDGTRAWSDYTPYELRSVSALLRLGQPARARAMLDFFLGDRRPRGWNQWAEVVGRDAREPRFICDMPHAWVASDALRSLLDLFAFERDSDGALVLGAGVAPAWWRRAPVELRGLSTSWGTLDLRLARAGDELRVRVGGGFEPPPGGVWFAWGGEGAPPPTGADGRALDWHGRLLRLPDGARELRLKLPPGE